jgi:hypothetical protein
VVLDLSEQTMPFLWELCAKSSRLCQFFPILMLLLLNASYSLCLGLDLGNMTRYAFAYDGFFLPFDDSLPQLHQE